MATNPLKKIKELTVEEAEIEVKAKENALITAKQDLIIAKKREIDYEKSKLHIRNLEAELVKRDKEIAELNRLKGIKTIKKLKQFTAKIHDHLLGNETLYDDELEELMEVLQSI